MLLSIRVFFTYKTQREDFVVYIILIMKSWEAVVWTEQYSTTVTFYKEWQLYEVPDIYQFILNHTGTQECLQFLFLGIFKWKKEA